MLARMVVISLGKSLLRHAFENDHLLPEGILWRQKAAFSDAGSVPLHDAFMLNRNIKRCKHNW